MGARLAAVGGGVLLGAAGQDYAYRGRFEGQGCLAGTGGQFLGAVRKGLGTLLADPAGQEGLRVVANPLVEQSRDFTADIGSVIQARQFEAL